MGGIAGAGRIAVKHGFKELNANNVTFFELVS
jgi:hypothetical protein